MAALLFTGEPRRRWLLRGAESCGRAEGQWEKVALVEFPDPEGGNAFGWRDSPFGSFLGCGRDFSCDPSAAAFTIYSLPLVLVLEKVGIASSLGRFLRSEVFTRSVFIQLGLLDLP